LIKISYDDKKGRTLFTNSDLKAGTTFFVEKGVSVVNINNDNNYICKVCHHFFLKGKYDDIYHLAGIVWITDPKTGKDIYLKTERRPKIQWDMVKQFNVTVTDKLKSITVVLDNNQPTLTDLIHDSIKLTYGGTQYDQYDPVYSNCQRYILGLMNGLFKSAG
jgi:hypothetical protein